MIRRTTPLLLLLACTRARSLDAPVGNDTERDTEPAVGDTDGPALPWDDAPCEALALGADPWTDTIARWTAQDDDAPPPTGGLVLTGSSSIRRWETAARALSAWRPVQRGFGGSLLGQVARHAEALVLRHEPGGVVVFAGTNDVAGGLAVDDVLTSYRCLAERVLSEAPGAPLLFVGITPTPSRWAGWDRAAEVNDAVQALATQHDDLVYIDNPSPFLALGQPPPDRLFVGDRLHLSEEGYALWTETIAAAVRAHVPEPAAAPGSPPTPGTLIRVDLGPSNPEDGAAQRGPDAFGIHWNAWHDVGGSEQVLAGEALRDLVDTTGATTTVDLEIAGGFRANGRRNGGLADPDGDDLGTLAVPDATVDFFYTGNADDPGALTLTGLDPDAGHTLRLFASRDDAQTRVTRFVVHGAGTAEATLTTTGPGSDGGTRNEAGLVVLTDLQPDAWGRLHLDVRIDQGDFAYLSLLELEVQQP